MRASRGTDGAVRAFLAVEIPTVVKDVVVAEVDRIRPALPPAKWVRPDNLHLTLRFLGDIDGAMREELQRALAPVFRRHRSFSLRLGRAGVFPQGRPARVAWIGLVDDELLGALAADVIATSSSLVPGSDSARRNKFSAHLTVARCRPAWPRAVVRRWESELPGPIGESFIVSRGVLMRSRLTRGGAIYDHLREFPLGDVH